MGNEEVDGRGGGWVGLGEDLFCGLKDGLGLELGLGIGVFLAG